MTYYYSKTTHFKFDEAVSRVTQALKEEGFGILTEIDVKTGPRQGKVTSGEQRGDTYHPQLSTKGKEQGMMRMMMSHMMGGPGGMGKMMYPPASMARFQGRSCICGRATM